MHTGPIPVVITAQITLNLVIGSEFGMPVSASFHYSVHEPLSVRAAFNTGDGAVTWVFARDLLRDGLDHPVGDGDVTCWPATDAGERVLCISLRSPSGQALLEAPYEQVRDFLHRTFDVVPTGAESDFLDLDGLIHDLLSSSG